MISYLVLCMKCLFMVYLWVMLGYGIWDMGGLFIYQLGIYGVWFGLVWFGLVLILYLDLER